MTALATQTNGDYTVERKLGILLRRAIAIVLFVAVVAALTDFPYAQIPLSIGLCVYIGILYFHPNAWLVVIPALLPVLDLAPWSGRFFFDEFDFLILTTVAVMLWRGNTQRLSARAPRTVTIAVATLALSYLVSMFLGLFPLDPLDANAFANYFSRYNSLRVAKGFLWAIFLLNVTPRSSAPQISNADYKRLFTLGMVSGLIALNIGVLYERLIFAGLFNFSSDLRAIATFSGLHNGGNDIEAYLVFAAPFIVGWVFDQRIPGRYFLGAVLFAFTSYSLLVTFSRGGYLGFLVAWLTLIVCLLLLAGSRSFSLPPLRAPSFAIFLVLLGAGVALPILKGDFIRARFTTIALDWQSRLDQLQNTFSMMNRDTATALFGMGLGRFPATYLAKQPANSIPTVYTFKSELSHDFVRIKAGTPLYIGQRVRTEPGKSYILSLGLRSVHQKGELRVPICEKQLQKSFRCQWLQFRSTEIGAWEYFEKHFNMGEVGGDVGRRIGRLSRRPVELALYNPARGSIIDVDNVKLIDDTGTNLIANGDFSRGQDRWFFTVDDLMPWQSSNHWGQIIFEQGWVGLWAFNFLILTLLVGLLLKVHQGDLFSGVVFAGVLGFLTVGLFGSLFDTPRMATLFYFVSMFPFRCERKAAVELGHEDSSDTAVGRIGNSS